MTRRSRLLFRLALAGLVPAASLPARPVAFDVPAQPVADALLAFSQQAEVELIFPADELRAIEAREVKGTLEPEEALDQLLANTGFSARRNRRGKFVVSAIARADGTVEGRLLLDRHTPARTARVTIVELRRTAVAGVGGDFVFSSVPAGTYQVVASLDGYRPLQLSGVRVEANRILTLPVQTFPAPGEATQLEPYLVEIKSDEWRPFDRSPTAPASRYASGNLDLRRSEDGPLPYTVFYRERIVRAGVVDLNQFLQRELLEGNASVSTPDQNALASAFDTRSSNLSLRGYSAEETVVLVNGRRLPEVVSASTDTTRPAPDVNLIPLSLIERVEVLPASASALYSGNAVGGVINIILRPDAAANATEVTTTYSNALGGFDAAQSSVSILHGQTLLGGRLRLRLNGSFSESTPPTEAELGYRASRLAATTSMNVSPGTAVFGATPNVRTLDGSALLPGSASFASSVAPGADGSGGIAAFNGRAGVRSLGLYDGPGGLATSQNSVDYPYGREQRRTAWFGSAVYDVTPWLQLGADVIHSETVIHRGFDVFAADLSLPASSPLNPFGKNVRVSLYDTAAALGEEYNEARIGLTSAVLGAVVKLPGEWRVSLDAQSARNIIHYRGIADVDTARWQALVDRGVYQPLRDTGRFGPPAAFYDEALIYTGRRGEFVRLGDYDILDGAVRLTNENLPLPTGRGTLNVGGDYRRNRLASYLEAPRFGDGTVAKDPILWVGRALERTSAFGELQAPLLPVRLLPCWMESLEVDVAGRYVAADTSQETNFAPTFALRMALAGGWAVRGSVTTASRYPTPQMGRAVSTVTGGPGGGPVALVEIFDPRRGNETYTIRESESINPGLRPEEAITQTAGVSYAHGTDRRLRIAVDFFDTQKTDETYFPTSQQIINLESIYPLLVTRDAPSPGDAFAAGRVASVVRTRINVARRHSRNWNLSAEYAWKGPFGGTLDLHARWVYFQRFDVQLLPGSATNDELRSPSTSDSSLLRHRVTFGAGWSNPVWSFGVDGQYFHSRPLSPVEADIQGAKEIDPYTQYDAFLQRDLTAWLPWKTRRYGLTGQIRVNNITDAGFPSFLAHSSGAGVQPYGDWRGRTYSLSLTATF